MFKTTIIAACAATSMAVSVQAATCGEQAASLAAEFRMAQDVPGSETSKGVATVPATPPATVESRGLMGTDRVEPPLEKPTTVPPPAVGLGEVPPPRGESSRALPPRGAPDRPAMRPGAEGFSLEDHQKAEALLSTAKEADAAGRPQECEQRLQEAKRLLPGNVPR